LADAQARRRLLAAAELTSRYDYAAAQQLLRDAAAELGGPANLERLQRGINLCRAFEEGDRLDHRGAAGGLDAYPRDVVPHWRELKGVWGEDRAHGFEWVEDLLLNAERRSSQGRCDDAVGRVYRAVELTAQVWLKERHGVDTGDVDLGLVPTGIKARIERAR